VETVAEASPSRTVDEGAEDAVGAVHTVTTNHALIPTTTN
jgi:hypothetical protein